MTMGLKVLFIVQFAVGALFSVSFLLTPKKSMKMFGVDNPSEQYVLLTRLYGAKVLLLCVVAWFAAGMADSVARQGIVVAYAVSQGVSFSVFLPYMIKKTLNPIGWIPTALEGLFAVAYVYFAVTMSI
jgi:hypothetical protein